MREFWEAFGPWYWRAFVIAGVLIVMIVLLGVVGWFPHTLTGQGVLGIGCATVALFGGAWWALRAEE